MGVDSRRQVRHDPDPARRRRSLVSIPRGRRSRQNPNEPPPWATAGTMDHMTRYDSIGHGYGHTRREDPRIAARVHRALSDARTVVNVGAGTGSYEPRDRHVVAIEPSDVMASERPRDRAPAIRARAGALPLRDEL